ncbi:MAG TPA: c-type cytochrome [Gammaproteobacteria bacterium]|nr:c-type cytochrome [Gammaproteobacteria bacterium]
MRAAYAYWILPMLTFALPGQAQQPSNLAGAAAPQGTPPAISQQVVIGPQPGPDRPLPQLQNPYASDAPALTEGRRLFVWFNCYGCHGGRGGGGMGPSLRDAQWLYGKTPEDVFNSIAEGRQHGMPAWGTKLPADQIWKLTAYIESLGTAKEPDKPPANPVFPKLGTGEAVGTQRPLEGTKESLERKPK